MMQKTLSLQNRLLSWYQAKARDLPWRRTQDPYKIWVSEIMLQQTQVDTVIPYYKRWIKRFPTLSALAKAPLEEALKYWAGLGYYRRVRMLHEAAKALMGPGPNYRTQRGLAPLPRNVNDLMKLPGIGRYTAGAIASIAFNEKVPVLDGNVIRILTRIYAIPSDIGSPATIQKLWSLAESLLPDQHTGDFNQSLMELGATVCLPLNPKCSVCPVSNLCRAHQMNKETSFPVKGKKEKLQKAYSCALILTRRDKVLIQQQPKEGRWGGLWMFPFWKDKKRMFEETKLNASKLRHRATLYHGFTKYKVRLEVYEGALSGIAASASRPPRNDVPKGTAKNAVIASGAKQSQHTEKWVLIKELHRFAFPSPHRKIIEQVLNDE